jgi:hypothetical protein
LNVEIQRKLTFRPTKYLCGYSVGPRRLSQSGVLSSVCLYSSTESRRSNRQNPFCDSRLKVDLPDSLLFAELSLSCKMFTEPQTTARTTRYGQTSLGSARQGNLNMRQVLGVSGAFCLVQSPDALPAGGSYPGGQVT